jgi:N-acetylglutamate synthase-like GNAT family acetyltransferase
LKRLVRFSAKVPGVCNAKIGTLLKAINEDYQGNGISRSTFKRMTIKAKELGILTIHETERKNGSQSSNLYSFNRFPQSEPPKAEKLNYPKETNNQKNMD